MKKDILIISAFISDHKTITIRRLGEYRETGKSFVNKLYTYPKPKVIKKSKMLCVESLFNNSIINEKPFICFKAMCLIEDKKECIELLKDAVLNKLIKLSIGMNQLKEANLLDYELKNEIT